MKGVENTKEFINNLDLAKDLPLMDAYVRAYGSPDAMSMADYLKTWYQEKSKFLLPIFQNKLIHERKVDISKTTEIINYDLEEFFDSRKWEMAGDYIMRMLRFVFFKGSSRWDSEFDFGYEAETKFFDAMNSLLGESAIYANNSISLTSTLRVNPSCTNALSRPLVIQNGQKPFRAINSIVKALEPVCLEKWPEAFDDKYFNTLHNCIEASRILHSQILNSSNIEGTLCISIHPLDYITMSDNSYDWESCMTWTREDEPGEHRAGTIEMLNSPCVVVAYIKGNKPYYPLGEDSVYTWNNKKWRELFIIDHDFIIGIRGYPYQAKTLEKMVLNELAELAAAAGYSRYLPTVKETERHAIQITENYELVGRTSIMYNDFACHKCYYIVAENPTNFYRTEFNYSGPAICIECGNPINPNAESSVVVCDNCNGIIRCSCCGEPLYLGISHYFVTDNDEVLCEDCGSPCDYCGKVVNQQTTPLNMIEIAYRSSNSVKASRVLTCTCNKCYDKLKPYIATNILETGPDTYHVGYNILLPIVPDDIYNDFEYWVPPKEEIIDRRELFGT